MKLCRFRSRHTPWASVGVLEDPGHILDLSSVGVPCLTSLLDLRDLKERVNAWKRSGVRRLSLSEVHLLAPVERQEVWAAGVTYLRSKTARMEESDFSATAYDRVYEADRPELFFKSAGRKVSATGGPVGIRSDAKWNVPEPELALVLNPEGAIVGYTHSGWGLALKEPKLLSYEIPPFDGIGANEYIVAVTHGISSPCARRLVTRTRAEPKRRVTLRMKPRSRGGSSELHGM